MPVIIVYSLQGMTHLHYAAMYENTFAVSELIKRGLNPNITDKNVGIVF